jgi:type IV pilus assembly protein PilA
MTKAGGAPPPRHPHKEIPMSQWFYAEGNRERRGPLPAENIAALFRSGRIAGDTLVWREGAGDWRPLRDFAAELGLDMPAGPAPEPAVPPLPPQVQHVHVVAPAPAPRPGLSGCAIFGIVAAVGGLMVVAVGGILAAIAVPAYNDYVLRAKVTAAHAQLQPLAADVAHSMTTGGHCPVNGDEGFHSPESYAGGDLAAVRIGRFGNGHCGLEARFHVPGKAALDGKHLWLDYDTQTATWSCSSDVADKHLPAHCRG